MPVPENLEAAAAAEPAIQEPLPLVELAMEEEASSDASNVGAKGEEVLDLETAPSWREELSERVQDFRRRRARLRRSTELSGSLDFDFVGTDAREPELVNNGQMPEVPRSEERLDVSLQGTSLPPVEVPVLDSVPLAKPGEKAEAIDATEVPLEGPTVGGEPVGIVLDSAELEPSTNTPEVAPLVLPLAPLGRRFIAGVLDTLVLWLAAGLFALVFWRAGGRLSPGPLNLAVLAFVAAFFIMAYFGLFTAIAASTPGLLWMGLEVRNLDGAFPTWRESFWRAFGYLVSIAALMLGFVWALVDSDNLTWHDRMSGTFLTAAEAGASRAAALQT